VFGHRRCTAPRLQDERKSGGWYAAELRFPPRSVAAVLQRDEVVERQVLDAGAVDAGTVACQRLRLQAAVCGGVMGAPVRLSAAVLLAFGLAGGTGALRVEAVAQAVGKHEGQARCSARLWGGSNGRQ
jgi:hypothetical protein